MRTVPGGEPGTGCRLFGVAGGAGGALARFQEAVVPGQVALQAVDLVARRRQAVELVRVDDELRLDAEAAQRLVHLLAPDRRDVEVLLAHEKERRRPDAVRVEERVRD